MPLIAHRNRPGNGGDERFLFDYLQDFNPILEYRFNEASGNALNSGSAGSLYDLTPAGAPTYQAGAGYTFGEVGNFYVDLDGTNDCFHTDQIAALTALTQGACMFIFQADLSQPCEIFMMKPEVGTGAFFQVRFDPTTVSNSPQIQIQVFDGTNVRRLNVVNEQYYRARPLDQITTHILIFQLDEANEDHRIWFDGVDLRENCRYISPGSNDVWDGTPAPNTFWFNDLVGLVDVMGFGARVEYDGAGSFASSSNNFGGRVEYAAFFPNPFTHEEAEEMFMRFFGGFDELQGAGEGLDAITTINSADGDNDEPHVQMLERRNNNWTNRSNRQGHTNRVVYQGSTWIQRNVNDWRLTEDLLTIDTGSGLFTTNLFPIFSLARGGAYVLRQRSSGSSEAWFGAAHLRNSGIDPSYQTGDGDFRIHIGMIATSFADMLPTWVWDKTAAGGEGGYSRVSSFIASGERPTNGNYVVGTVPNWLAADPDENFMAVMTRATSTANPQTGGIHIYALSGLGTLTPTAVRQTVSGYSQASGHNYRACGFFKNGTDLYLIVMSTNGPGANGLTGSLSGLGVLKRNNTTGIWEAQTGLINGGVDPLTAGTFLDNPDRYNEMHVSKDGRSIYLGVWSAAAQRPRGNNLVHLQWSDALGYWDFVDQPEWYPASESLAITYGYTYETPDGKGILIEGAGSDAALLTGVPTNVFAYDRDPVTGILTYRSNYFGGRKTNFTGEQPLRIARITASTRKWSERPNGIIGINP